jgi:hypothetical protein
MWGTASRVCVCVCVCVCICYRNTYRQIGMVMYVLSLSLSLSLFLSLSLSLSLSVYIMGPVLTTARKSLLLTCNGLTDFAALYYQVFSTGLYYSTCNGLCLLPSLYYSTCNGLCLLPSLYYSTCNGLCLLPSLYYSTCNSRTVNHARRINENHVFEPQVLAHLRVVCLYIYIFV